MNGAENGHKLSVMEANKLRKMRPRAFPSAPREEVGRQRDPLYVSNLVVRAIPGLAAGTATSVMEDPGPKLSTKKRRKPPTWEDIKKAKSRVRKKILAEMDKEE